MDTRIPASLNYNNNNQKNTKLQSSEIYQGIYYSMLSKDHDPDNSASEGSRTKRRHDEDDGAGHLVEKATLTRNHSQNEFLKSENLLLILRILVKGKFSTSLPCKDSMKCPRHLNPFTEGRGIVTKTLKISIKHWHS
ncbi:hypothetical protein ACB098_09G160500 [Castanea mollissima]